jgi:hypothetical protein
VGVRRFRSAARHAIPSPEKENMPAARQSTSGGQRDDEAFPSTLDPVRAAKPGKQSVGVAPLQAERELEDHCLQFRPRQLASESQAPSLAGGGEFDEAEQYRPHRDPSEHG